MIKNAAIVLALLMLFCAAPARADSGLLYNYIDDYVGSFPEAVAMGDVNGDGRTDVVMTTSSYSDPNDYKLIVYLQQADTQLADPVFYQAGNGLSVGVGDLNNDGRADVAVTLDSGIGVFLQTADGRLAPMVTYAPRRTDITMPTAFVRVSDMNGDGLLDVVAMESSGDGVNVHFQNANGTLNAPARFPVLHGGGDDLEVGDVNHDGLPDIVVMSGQGYSHSFGVLLQQPGGTFSAPVYYYVGVQYPGGIAVGDVNGDGRADVVVTYGGNYPASHLAVFYQNESGSLNPPVALPANDIPDSVEVADINHDGRMDILVLHGGWSAMSVYLQDGQGGLLPYELYELPYASWYNSHGIAVGDVSGDGLRDVAIADYNNGLVMLYHRSQTGIPDIETDASADFGTQYTGSLSERTIYVWNDGPSDLVLGAVSLGGPDSAEFSIAADACTGLTLGIWDYCTVVVRFQPGTTGSKTAHLSVPSNDPDEPVASVPLLNCATSRPGDTLFSPYVAKTLGSTPEAVAVADLNGDGRDDVALITSAYNDYANDNHLFVYLQNAQGGLDNPVRYATSAAGASAVQSLAVGDVNGDGKADVVVGTMFSTLDVFLQNASGGLDPAVTYATDSAYSVKVGDLNNDGRDDIVGINTGDKAVIFFQTASGTLNPPVNYTITTGTWSEVDIGDANHDGLNDIIVVQGSAGTYNLLGVLLQNADGTFAPAVYYDLGTWESAHGVAIGDLNNDGWTDVVETYGGNTPGSGIGVFFQDALGTLNNKRLHQSYDLPYGVEIADVTGDGKNDILVMHQGWSAVGVYRNDPVCTIGPEELYSAHYGANNPQGIAVGDINGDGLNDVVSAYYGGELDILPHASPAGAPNISTPKTVRFGSVVVGTASDRTISIANIGEADLTITSASISGTNGADFSVGSSCAVIPAGGSCNLVVGFTPAAAGPRTAVLQIVSNDPDLPARNIPLSGTGYVEQVTLIGPNGGEVLSPGAVYQIRWSAPASAVRFNLRYSISNGSIWKAIASGVTGTSFVWTVPAVTKTKTECLVDVTAYDSAGLQVGTDRSDGTFTILK